MKGGRGRKFFFPLLLSFIVGFLGSVCFVVVFPRLPSGWRTPTPPEKGSIGVINWERLWATLPAMQKLREDLNGQLHHYHQEFAAYEKTLRARQNELTVLQKKTDLEDKAQARKLEENQKAFSHLILETQKKAEARQRQVNEAYQAALRNLNQKIRREIEKVALARKMQVVLTASQTAFFGPEFDITDEVLKALSSSDESTSFTEELKTYGHRAIQSFRG